MYFITLLTWAIGLIFAIWFIADVIIPLVLDKPVFSIWDYFFGKNRKNKTD